MSFAILVVVKGEQDLVLGDATLRRLVFEQSQMHFDVELRLVFEAR